MVLANGTFMFGPSGKDGLNQQALLNPSDLTWTVTGTGMIGNNPEAAFTLLPDGHVLMVDSTLPTNASTEMMDPTSGAWTSAGTLPAPLIDPTTAGAGPVGEIGPDILMPNGTVFAEGSNSATDVYNTTTGKWSAGPSFAPINGASLSAGDCPAAILPDGNVLTDVSSPGFHGANGYAFIFDGTSLTQIARPPGGPVGFDGCQGEMLDLANGQVLLNTLMGNKGVDLYTSTGTPNPSWLPQITNVANSLVAGSTDTLSGQQLNGLTQGLAFGDNFQDATNYPLVQITNQWTGDVTYARSMNMTSMSVASMTPSSTQFQLPASLEDGPSQLRVVASGVASAPVSVTVTGGTPETDPSATTTTLAPRKPPAKKHRTIVCVDGKKMKRITGVAPRCPSGFKLKR